MSTSTQNELVRDAVEQALDALLVALVELDGVPDVETPVDSLDLALRNDESYQVARQHLVAVLVHVQVVLGNDNTVLFLRAEEHVNAVVSAGIDVGFRLAFAAAAAKAKE